MFSMTTPVRRSVLMLALASGAVLSLAAPSAQTGAPAVKSSGPARACPTPEEPAVAAAPQAAQVAASTSAVAEPTMTGALRSPGPDPFGTRIVVVEWKIKKGRECDFLNYWATRSTIPNRAGLIGEFLSEVDPKPWINWSLDEGWTTYYNVGIWRDAAAFEDQIGKHIDNSRPPLEFEAGKRARVFLAPERWRVGATTLPVADPAGVH
jgi:hypothetical protein